MFASLSGLGRRFAHSPRETPNYRRAGAMNCHLLKDIGVDCPQARWTTGYDRTGRPDRE